MTGKYVGLLALLIFQGYLVLAQPAPPTYNVLTRILMVESQHGRGSIFSIDVDNREYWITAKHVLTGAEHPPYGAITAKTVSLQLLNPGGEGQQWIPVTFSVIDPGPDIDIVVLAPPQPLLTNPLPSVAADSTGMLLGGDCEFLGFPYGGGWRARFDNGQSFWMPFVKHCTVSAMSEDGKQIYVLDGINNAGLSGGPVIFKTGPDQRIMAVVSGYHTEPAEIVFSSSASPALKERARQSAKLAAHPRGTVNLNSGFIIAYGINYATEAIKKEPIGPLRKPK
jgi:hypothetical protein